MRYRWDYQVNGEWQPWEENDCRRILIAWAKRTHKENRYNQRVIDTETGRIIFEAIR